MNESQFPSFTEADVIRTERNRLLRISDWTQANDSPLTSEKKEEWKVYRQALRNLTMTRETSFPVPPTK